MSNKEQWICVQNGLSEIPFIVDSESEVMDLFNKWNLKDLENEGKITKNEEDFSYDGVVRKITKMYLTCDGYGFDDPYATATLYNYSNIMKYITEVKNEHVISKCVFNPLTGLDNPYTDINHRLRIKKATPSASNKSPFDFMNFIPSIKVDTSSNIAVVIVKEETNKFIEINSQKDLFRWLQNNLNKKEICYNINDSTLSFNEFVLCQMRSNSSSIGLSTRRGYGNTVVVGSKIAEVVSNNTTNYQPLYISNDFDYIGCSDGIFIYTPKDTNLIDPYSMFISYVGTAIDVGINLLKDGDHYYLTKLDKNENYLGSYEDYFRIIKFNNIT